MSVDSTDELMDILPCVSCGVNADPADGFGKCTCGNEAKRAALQSLIEDRVREARIDELRNCVMVAGEELVHGRAMVSDNDNGSLVYGVEEKYFHYRIAQLSNSKDSK